MTLALFHSSGYTRTLFAKRLTCQSRRRLSRLLKVLQGTATVSKQLLLQLGLLAKHLSFKVVCRRG